MFMAMFAGQFMKKTAGVKRHQRLYCSELNLQTAVIGQLELLSAAVHGLSPVCGLSPVIGSWTPLRRGSRSRLLRSGVGLRLGLRVNLLRVLRVGGEDDGSGVEERLNE